MGKTPEKPKDKPIKVPIEPEGPLETRSGPHPANPPAEDRSAPGRPLERTGKPLWRQLAELLYYDSLLDDLNVMSYEALSDLQRIMFEDRAKRCLICLDKLGMAVHEKTYVQWLTNQINADGAKTREVIKSFLAGMKRVIPEDFPVDELVARIQEGRKV